ncbi:helix-turn-helix domain-containing protein [Paraburkholderia sartisoli]|uniref:helix-turn-helix domain-containing protein n=1 Tax=Paraburkholderia sartisoli TaxID=83784 RepID=UPI001FE12D63|nr:helix-turn-helix domain-containing protein [Paraburkholderia sartisoli]
MRVGQDHQRAKLSDAAVEMIRKLHEEGMSYSMIAVKFEISRMQAWRICNYRERGQSATRFRTLA